MAADEPEIDVLKFDDALEIIVVSGPSPLDRRLARLTAAEAEVARLILDGLSNQEIAAQRGASTRTVDGQVQDILRAYDVQSRTELARALVGPDEPRPQRRERRTPRTPRKGRSG